MCVPAVVWLASSPPLSAHNCVCRLTLIFLCEHYLPCLSSLPPPPPSPKADERKRRFVWLFIPISNPLPPTLRAKQSVFRAKLCPKSRGPAAVTWISLAADVGLGLRRPPTTSLKARRRRCRRRICSAAAHARIGSPGEGGGGGRE